MDARVNPDIRSHWIGWALVVISIMLAPVSAAGLFGPRRTTLNSAGHPDQLVTDGGSRLSRNPMYLGVTFGYFGLRAWHS
jgi:protein-S-isoprenylcysteine O-methyltransferase Ste14